MRSDLRGRWEQTPVRKEGIRQMNCERAIPGTIRARDMPTARAAEDFATPKCFVVCGKEIGFGEREWLQFRQAT